MVNVWVFRKERAFEEMGEPRELAALLAEEGLILWVDAEDPTQD